MTVTDPVKTIARTTAKRLAASYGAGMPGEVEAVLRAERTPQRRDQYIDPVSIASLIVAVATLAWTIYSDLRRKTPEPSAEAVAQELRFEMRDHDGLRPEYPDLIIISIVVEEVIRAANSGPEVTSVGQKIKKGTRAPGVDRRKLAADLKRRYDAGESVRSLAVSTGRSYGFIHRLLTEAGVRFRGRSGTAGGNRRALDAGQPEIPVQVYLADTLPGPAVEQALREVLLTSGVEDIRETPVVTGSWYRSLTGLLKRAADSEAAAEARRAVELQVLDRFQAGIDGVTGDAVAKLITALDHTSGAVIQVGSVLLVKAGGTIVVRQLTAREMTHWQHNPGLFKDPAAALGELQRAIQSGPSASTPGHPPHETPEQQARPA
jgi:hypothetical protein